MENIYLNELTRKGECGFLMCLSVRDRLLFDVMISRKPTSRWDETIMYTLLFMTKKKEKVFFFKMNWLQKTDGEHCAVSSPFVTPSQSRQIIKCHYAIIDRYAVRLCTRLTNLPSNVHQTTVEPNVALHVIMQRNIRGFELKNDISIVHWVLVSAWH